MERLKYEDYDMLVLLALGGPARWNEYIEIPSYLELPSGIPSSSDDVAQYLNRAYNKFKEKNPEFIKRLGESIDFFLKKTHRLDYSVVEVENLKRGYKMLKEANKDEAIQSTTKKKDFDSRMKNSTSKIVWNGQQKEFAELIKVLEKKNWIEIPDGKLQGVVNTLVACFDFAKTKKNKESDPGNSLYQILKPSESELKITTKRYSRKFGAIVENVRKLVT